MNEKTAFLADDTSDISEEPPESSLSGGPLPDPDTRIPGPVRLRLIQPSSRASAKARGFRLRFFPSAGQADWDDWNWQLANRITSLERLGRMLHLTDMETQVFRDRPDAVPLSITPYYASLLDPIDPSHALRRSVVPTIFENLVSPGESPDPLAEDRDTPVPGLVHRYPDRVLFLAAYSCSTYCRYCTRSRAVGSACAPTPETWEHALEYIREHKEIRDVLISGGDPLILPDEIIDLLLSRISAIPHVEFIRIGTKVPAVMPQRITRPLIKVLRKYRPLWISIHATHPDELTPEMRHACDRLANAGIPLGSQTVLLAGINDCAETLKKLYHGLLTMRVRPYYLYQCDPISGSNHFRTSVRKGLEIMRNLRGFTSGYAVPTYVIDAPGGGGKIPLLPEYIAGYEEGSLLLKNYEGRLFRYPDKCVDQGQ
ncbi:MAG: KamA family radical SAM protein [Spirochaetales bacterium]|jgi:lysine 2,3-aminomutase|nr:KamA family radical SAM protein [Spirochaetales bacterium]